MSFTVSVVVPTCKRPELLNRCLQALVAQAFASEYEIIVVDDGADEVTRRVVNRWAGELGLSAATTRLSEAPDDARPGNTQMKIGSGASWGGGPSTEESAFMTALSPRRVTPAIRYIAMTTRRGPAAARNAGWRAARGDIIAFTDDDCVPAPGWLAAGVAAFQSGVVGVSGHIDVPLPSEPTDYERNAAFLGCSEFVTANCFYYRTLLAAVGGFDEQFTSAWREDSDLFFTLLEYTESACLACRFVEAPDAIVIHPLRRAGWGVSVQQQRKNIFNALLYKKHPRLYRKRLRSPIPWHYYITVALVLLALVGFLTGQWNVAAAAAGAWTGMTLRFFAYRLKETSRRPGHVIEMLVTSTVIPPLALFWRGYGALKFRVWFL